MTLAPATGALVTESVMVPAIDPVPSVVLWSEVAANNAAANATVANRAANFFKSPPLVA
jgi:hypothetical protein